MFQIERRCVGDVTVLDLTGRLIFGDETQMLGHEIRELSEADQKKVLLNMAGLDFIDSCGIGEVISSFTSLKKTGGVLKLCNAMERVDEVLGLVKLPQIIELHPSEEAALHSYEG